MYNTVSLELAKKLKEACWKKAGIFVYDNEETIENLQGYLYLKGEYKLKELRDIKRMHDDIIYAPQLHDILEELKKIKSKNGHNFKIDFFPTLELS